MKETLKTIMTRAEPWLREAPRKNWVKIRAVTSGQLAILFHSGTIEGGQGICLQYLDNSICYCFSDQEAQWEEIGHGDNVLVALHKPSPF